MLPAPARYSPWAKGVYEVAPNLKPFGTDFGNGDLDWVVFQFDCEFERYRKSKLAAMERKPLYVGEHELGEDVVKAAIDYIVKRLLEESPDKFSVDRETLRCALTGDQFELNGRDALDALLLQVQEDLAIVTRGPEGDWVSYVNVCSPSHWDPSTKLGLSFFTGHTVVPGFEKVNRAATGLVEAMIEKGPWVRFVWGVESDMYLDHHPITAPGHNSDLWYGRQFNSNAFNVRTERQVIWGLPQVNSALFFVRVGMIPGSEVLQNSELLNSLCSAVQSMSPAALEYKGLDKEFNGLIKQLVS